MVIKGLNHQVNLLDLVQIKVKHEIWQVQIRIDVKGHRSQVQVIALLMNIIGFSYLMEGVYYLADLCNSCEIIKCTWIA